MTDALVIELETPAWDPRDCRLVGTYSRIPRVSPNRESSLVTIQMVIPYLGVSFSAKELMVAIHCVDYTE